MIFQKLYEIQINAANHKHFSKWYTDLKCGQMISCTVDRLLKSSRVRIDVKCDLCSLEKSLEYRDYTKHGWVNGEYLCKKCKLQKTLGVRNVFELQDVKKKIKNSLIERYDVDNISKLEWIKDKKKQTTQKNFQVDYPQQSKSIQEKTVNTVKTKWNVTNISDLESIKSKKKQTYKSKTGYDFVFQNPEFIYSQIEKNKKNYGVTYSICAEEIKFKIAQTNLARWGFEIASKNDFIKSKIKKGVTFTLNKKTFDTINGLISIDSEKRIFLINCQYCNLDYEISWALFYKRRETKTLICTECNPIDRHQSGLELELYNFIKTIYDDEIKQNYKIESKELDIYLPKIRLAFEFNGLYWHSELYKERNYHFDKSFTCRKNDISLLHIWEDDWLYNRLIIESMIRNKLGITEKRISARKCNVEFILDKAIVNNFLNNNHIQGSTVFSVAVGLYLNDELISVMTFIKRKSSWELNRFCTILNCLVVGGASKLLNHFVKKYSKDVFTFSDNSYSSGNLYRKIGFIEEYHLKPDYSIFDSGIRRHKFNYRNIKIGELLRIWDAGKIKFRLH